MMEKYRTIAILAALILAAFLAACGAGTDSTQDIEVSDPLPPVAVVRAREALAAHLAIPVAEVPFGTHEPAEWTDSCLGLGGAAESCLAAIHPGWRVNFEVDGIPYEVRTDELGEIIRVNDE